MEYYLENWRRQTALAGTDPAHIDAMQRDLAAALHYLLIEQKPPDEILRVRPGLRSMLEILVSGGRVDGRSLTFWAQLAAEGLAWDVCHGDLYPDNAHIAEDDTVTVFDFDCGGPGWWAYDLAGFRHEGALANQGDDVWEAFFKGYTERREVNELDLQAIPVLVEARQVWLMGMRTSNVEHLGYAWIDDAYWDRMMKLLRELVAKYGDGKERPKGDIIL